MAQDDIDIDNIKGFMEKLIGGRLTRKENVLWIVIIALLCLMYIMYIFWQRDLIACNNYYNAVIDNINQTGSIFSTI